MQQMEIDALTKQAIAKHLQEVEKALHANVNAKLCSASRRILPNETLLAVGNCVYFFPNFAK